jgi:hypothetical protein
MAATSALHAAGPSDSYVGSTATFSLEHKTDVPGKTLNPGKYAIIVVDQFSDRMVVRVQSETGKDHAIFLGVPDPAIGAASAGGPVEWKKGPTGAPALRGFAFSPGSGVEFVYPKAEAAQIATKNSAQVVAVDPESESLPPVRNMSKDDMQMVSLWTLSLTSVGTAKDKTPAIAAQKYQGETIGAARPALAAKSAPVQTEPPKEVAKLDPPAMGEHSIPALPRRRPVVAKLPHTGSPVATVGFLGIFCLLAAGALRLGSVFAGWRASRG